LNGSEDEIFAVGVNMLVVPAEFDQGSKFQMLWWLL
jgi:hypothetical protein